MELMTVLKEQPGRMHGWKANGIFSKLWVSMWLLYFYTSKAWGIWKPNIRGCRRNAIHHLDSLRSLQDTHTPHFFIFIFFFPSIYYTASNIWNKWSLTSDFALFLTSLLQIFLTFLGTARYLGHACALQEKQAFDPTHPFAWISWNL